MIQLLPVPSQPTVHSKLEVMKDLKQKMKELESYYNQLKQEVISEYFNDHEEFRTPQGLLLATYKLVERTTFEAAKFRNDHPEFDAEYTKSVVVPTFNIVK